MYEWNEIPWHKLERRLFKLQKRIYQASSRGNVVLVRRLQKLLIKSWTARTIAVRRVTQDNQGKKTAGVDGVKSLSPKARITLVHELTLNTKASPTRRVWIPKAGVNRMRPLGIPTMKDRALQALVKLALEPEWESRFEPNSYGFRPGRSCHDAIEAIFNGIRYKPKFVLDADIKQCFDRISHQRLLEKLNTYPSLRRQIRAWLKAGCMDKTGFNKTTMGTPQGGVISPLLANIALHGMENLVKEWIETQDVRYDSGIQIAKTRKRATLTFVRYADDFVLLHKSETIITELKKVIERWLNDIGLTLSPNKTRISHTLRDYHTENPGFNFLGFKIRQFQAGKTTSGKNGTGQLLGFKTIISPSKDSIKHHYLKIREMTDIYQALPQSLLISRLNPIIKGWCNYFSTVSSKKCLSKMKDMVYWKLYKWGIHRHPNKTRKWVGQRYFRKIGKSNWTFACNENGKLLSLYKHDKTHIKRHVKVKGEKSPFDGDWIYWSSRLGKHPTLPKNVAVLLKQQLGKCAWCKTYFTDVDTLEIDHIVPICLGGNSEYKNLQLLHRHCHDFKTTIDGSLNFSNISESVDV